MTDLLPAIRSEREVAADVVVALVHASMLAQGVTPTAAAGVAGVSLEDLADAELRYQANRRQPPKPRPVLSNPVTRQPAPVYPIRHQAPPPFPVRRPMSPPPRPRSYGITRCSRCEQPAELGEFAT